MSSISRSRSRSPINDRSRSRSRSPHRRGERRRMVVSRRVIISNIPYDMKWQDIKDLFRKEVGDVTYVELWENPDGKPKGAGIIEFKDKETAQKAIDKMHRYDLKGRDLVVREERESDRLKMTGGMGMGGGSMGMGGLGMGMGGGGMGMGMGGSMMGGEMGGISPQVLQQLGIDGPISNIVFVSNLDYKVTWKKLKDVFKLAGNVIRAEIKQDKDGKSRGMGTVQFEFPMEALQAISMFNNQTLYDRAMRVKMDSASAPDPVKNVQLPSGLKSIGMGLGLGGTPLKQLNPMSGMGGGSNGMGMGMGIGSMDSAGMGSGMGSSMGSGMSGMGTGMSGMGMGGMSGMSGMSGMGTGMKQGTMGMGMGSGLGAGLSSGMGMNDSFSTGMGGSNSYGTSSGMGDYGGLGSGMGSGSFSSSMMDSFGSRMTSSGTGYGMSSLDRMRDRDRDRDRDRGRTGTRPDNCTISVKNLPYSYGWQTLKEKFREVGDVKFAEIRMEAGKSSGWGLVRFGNSDDAQRAVELMNRAKFDGREVDVRIYRG